MELCRARRGEVDKKKHNAEGKVMSDTKCVTTLPV